MEPNRRIDPTERAHLRDAAGYTPPIHRFAPSAELTGLVRRYWMPVWSLPEGQRSVQRVLQYPVCLVVVSSEYALLVGPSTGLSTQELAGSGWALGTMLQPAAGSLVLGRSVDTLTDRRIPLAEVDGIDGSALAGAVHAAVADDPEDPAAQQAGVAAVERALTPLLPLDEEGLLVNAVVEHVENDAGVHRVSQVCAEFSLSERSLQRLTRRRIGLSPKWLVQRRRLHEAAERLKSDSGQGGPAGVGDRPDLARVAVELGYADQSHFARDFRTVTGLTPGAFAAEPWRS